MNKWIWIGIGVAVLIIVVIVLTRKPAEADNNELAEIGALLKEPSGTKRDCRRICSTITKGIPLFKRRKPRLACMSDCGRGLDVTKKIYA